MLQIKNLNYSVPAENGTLEILKNINLTFEDGKTYAITGHNGSGKSTLAKLIMGIIKPTSGNILYNGKDITSLSPTERANLKIAFAFQQPVRFKGLTVKDIISVAENKDNASNNITNCCEYLSLVGLCARDYINRELDSKLSGGELKRIEIATTLARQAQVNIFDEPEAGIDLWSFEALIEIFKNLKLKNSTNIIVSHQEKLLQTADQIIVLSNGEITNMGVPKKILKQLNPASPCKKLRRK